MISLFLPVSQGEIPCLSRIHALSAHRLMGESAKYTGSRDRGNCCLGTGQGGFLLPRLDRAAGSRSLHVSHRRRIRSEPGPRRRSLVADRGTLPEAVSRRCHRVTQIFSPCPKGQADWCKPSPYPLPQGERVKYLIACHDCTAYSKVM